MVATVESTSFVAGTAGSVKHTGTFYNLRSYGRLTEIVIHSLREREILQSHTDMSHNLLRNEFTVGFALAANLDTIASCHTYRNCFLAHIGRRVKSGRFSPGIVAISSLRPYERCTLQSTH